MDRQATRKQRPDARPEPATRHAPAKRAPLPATRPELLALHRELRQRRDAAPLDSRERADAMEAIARVEVEVARRERAMEPPRV